MKKKKFDCIEMKRRGALAIYEKIKNETIEGQVQFWKQGTNELKALQQKMLSSVKK